LGGTQARTKIDVMRFGSLLPSQSLVQIDAADIAELERSGNCLMLLNMNFCTRLDLVTYGKPRG
jgi:hypothetical protein